MAEMKKIIGMRRIIPIIVFVMVFFIFIPSALCAERWAVDLNITSGSAFDMVTFGIVENATDDFDPVFDEPQPPAPPVKTYVRAYFYYPNNSVYLRELATSYIAPANLLNWPLRIECAGSSTNVTITWNSTKISELDYILQLHAQDKDVNMSEYDSYTFSAEPYLVYTFNLSAQRIYISPESMNQSTTVSPSPTTISEYGTRESGGTSPTTTPTPSPLLTTPLTTINQTPSPIQANQGNIAIPSNTNNITPTPIEKGTQPLVKIPGFECILAIIGLLITVFMRRLCL
jgi:hypothetical protein